MLAIRPRPCRPRILASHHAAALLLALALLLPGIIAAPVARADSCTVTTAADNLVHPVAGSLRQSLPNCETITFDLVQMGTSTIQLLGALTITRPLTITGPGKDNLIIQGNNTFPLLNVDVPGQAVAISGLTLTKGKAVDNYGGDLRVLHVGTLALTDVALTNATANAGVGGAGAYIGSGKATLTRVTISGNSAPGSIAHDNSTGAGLFVDESYGDTDMTIADSIIADNSATSYNGGGLAVVRDSGADPAHILTIRLDRTTISGNQANTGSGGGVYASDGILTLTNSTISGNQATYGAGLYMAVATVTLTNSTISDNSAQFAGGGLFTAGVASAAILRFATVTGNTSDSGSLGYEGGGLYRLNGAISVLGSVVVGNRIRMGILGDCTAGIVSQGRNVWGDHATCPTETLKGDQDLGTLNLAPGDVVNPTLADNGGPTRTHTLVAGSPALDHGEDAACALDLPGGAGGKDQRGIVTRPQGPHCDVGAVEVAYFALTVAVQGSGTLNTAGSSYPVSTVVSLVPTPQPGAIFTGWAVDGTFQGWADPLGITMNADHRVVATFAPLVPFSDVGIGQPFTQSIIELAARGYIRGYGDGTYGPNDTTLRAQMAALIARAMGYTDSPANPFTDKCDPTNPANCVDDELWNRVAELANRSVARGYTDAATCAPSAVPCYAPRDFVLHAQVLSFITRAMEDAHYWEAQSADPTLYAGVLTGTGHEGDVATYVHYTQSVGGVPDYPVGGFFPAWDQAATRGWFARALWSALNSYWSVDRVP